MIKKRVSSKLLANRRFFISKVVTKYEKRAQRRIQSNMRLNVNMENKMKAYCPSNNFFEDNKNTVNHSKLPSQCPLDKLKEILNEESKIQNKPHTSKFSWRKKRSRRLCLVESIIKQKVNKYAIQAQLKRTLWNIDEAESFEEMASFPSFRLCNVDESLEYSSENCNYSCISVVNEEELSPLRNHDKTPLVNSEGDTTKTQALNM